jgi:hypothetical protein
MAAVSMFTQLQQAGHLLEVPMDGVQILLPESGKFAIGTEGLNGCTCVVIVGDAIILAHISPFPGSFSRLPTDIPQASRDHHNDFLNRIRTLHKAYQKYFPTNTTAWGIFSTDKHGSMKPVEDQARTALKNIGYDMRLEKYQEIDVQLWKKPKGELVGVMRGRERLLFLERRQLWPERKQPPVPQQTAPTAWWFENNKYTFYQGGVARTTQKGVPLRVRFYHPANKTVCYIEDEKKKPLSWPISQILAADPSWKLEGNDYVFYNNDKREVNRLKVIPTLVGISDPRNSRKILHDGKTLHALQMKSHAKDDEEEDDEEEDDEDEDDEEEDDEEADDEEEDDNKTQGFWAFSNQTRTFSYRTQDNKPMERVQSGRHRVRIAEEQRWMGYDFGTREWFQWS